MQLRVDESIKDVSHAQFDFPEIAFERMQAKLQDGVTFREYYRLAGLLFSLPKSQSRLLLAEIKKRHPEVRVTKR